MAMDKRITVALALLCLGFLCAAVGCESTSDDKPYDGPTKTAPDPNRQQGTRGNAG